MVIAEGTTLLTGIKTVMEIVDGLKSSHDADTVMKAQSEVFEQLFTIRAKALALQEEHLVLLNEKEELVKKLMEFEQWEKTKSKYELKQIIRGIFVYSLKNSQQSEEPLHWLCPNCWKDSKDSILQAEFDNGDEAKYFCPKCNKISFRYYHTQLL